MEIRHLRYFIAVAELRSFTKAAEASFVAQSALSQQISRLEHELGTPLFVRGKRGAELTAAGQLLLPHARRIVADEAWARAYTRAEGCFPAGTSRTDKYWCPVGRVDNVYGDRNLVCSCPPVEDYAQAAE